LKSGDERIHFQHVPTNARAHDDTETMLIHGSCHCGNIVFELRWEPDPERIPARACDCTFCTRHGGVWTAVPDAKLEVKIAQPALVSRYVFGTKTAEFHVCSRCGVVPVVTSTIDGRVYAVVNVNVFDEAAAACVQRMPASFDGEEESARLARRKRNWIGNVVFTVERGEL
jgi:hypothetical protein